MWITSTILEEEARCLGDFSRPDPIQLHYMYSVLHFVLGPGIHFIYMEIVKLFFSWFTLYMSTSPLVGSINPWYYPPVHEERYQNNSPLLASIFCESSWCLSLLTTRWGVDIDHGTSRAVPRQPLGGMWNWATPDYSFGLRPSNSEIPDSQD